MSEIKVTVYRTVQQKAEFMIDFDVKSLEETAAAEALKLGDSDFIDLEVDDEKIVIGKE
jgi:hypothetical protein